MADIETNVRYSKVTLVLRIGIFVTFIYSIMIKYETDRELK